MTKTSTKDNGDVFIELPSNENCQKLIPLLDTNTFEQNEVVQMKSKLPTITILGVKEYTSKEDFIEKLKKQNPLLTDKLDQDNEFSIIYCRKPREMENGKANQVVARVSDEVRKIIKNCDNKLYIDLEALRVVDRFYIKRCNNCQQFGHYEKDCSNEVRCGYCTNQHKSGDCDQVEEGDFEKYQCMNCKTAGKQHVGHSTHWHKCPTLLEQQKKIKKGIPYYNQKNS